MRTLFPILALLGLTLSGAQAQTTLQFSMTAKIEKLDKAPKCAPKATHKARCTNVYLMAGKDVDLSKWEGKRVDLVGRPALALCLVLEVIEVKSAPHFLRISARTGDYRLGDIVRFETKMPWLAVSPWLLSGKPSFVPVLQYGTLLLDPLNLVYIQNYIPLFGTLRLDVKIPNDKTLVGVDIYSQGAWLGLDTKQGLTGRLLNNDCFKIKAAAPK